MSPTNNNEHLLVEVVEGVSREREVKKNQMEMKNSLDKR